MKATKLNDQLLYQILMDDEQVYFSIIEHYGLTDNEVRLIVKEWYTNGMMPDILQNANGQDLEELVDLDFSNQ
jgi:hypothetical protein